MYNNFFKRFLDFVLAFIVLALLSPIFVVVTFWLYFVNQGRPFYLQERPGKDGEIFKIIKFKTMTDKRDVSGQLLPDSQRLTSAGAFVRRTSLDEIPQLINVIKGEMSIIGPRPLRTYYLPLYSAEQKRRHLVRPGITGWAQVNGRNNISWSKKFSLDVWYVDNLSFKLDLKIFLKTIYKVLNRDGISKDGHVTTEAFNGKN